MGSKAGIVLMLLSLVAALGAVGYATWTNRELQKSVSSLADAQDRNLKEMMISLAHTEGQLGRVKEAVSAFDLQKWLATVEGPLVDSLETKVGAVQREVVRAEVEKWAQQISREQRERWQSISQMIAQARSEIAKQNDETKQLEETLTAQLRRSEEITKKQDEEAQARFRSLEQQTGAIKEQLAAAERSLAELETGIGEVKAESQGFAELLNQGTEASRAMQTRLEESLQLLTDSVAKEQALTQEQMDQAAKQWQGLFLTLRENHDAEVQGYREVVERLEQERAQALERLRRVNAERQQETRRRVEQAREKPTQPMGELIEFCARRPESVLCRDVDVR